MTNKELFQLAVKASENSYSPYSGFHVGAALVAGSGKVYTGCNIENASYSMTICAERTAIFKAVSEGEREIKAIAVAGSAGDDFSVPCTPCGACLQVMSEFGGDDLVVILSDGEHCLNDFLPLRFTDKNLK